MTFGYPKANKLEFISFLYIFIQVKSTKPSNCEEELPKKPVDRLSAV